jgi:hypothetical protein
VTGFQNFIAIPVYFLPGLEANQPELIDQIYYFAGQCFIRWIVTFSQKFINFRSDGFLPHKYFYFHRYSCNMGRFKMMQWPAPDGPATV